MSRLRIVVMGAAGQLGGAVVQEFASHDVMGFTRQDVELTNHQAVLALVMDLKPDVLINCAAYNRVDDAEDDVLAAIETNAFAVRSLARAAEIVKSTFVHYSTDFVFDGTGETPYLETDKPNPRSVYGVSKLLGEWFASDAPKAYVLRVESLFGGTRARSSVDRIINAILAGQEVKVFTDRTVSPSYVLDVAQATRRLVELAPDPGLYHCVNLGHGTWLDLAAHVTDLLQRKNHLCPISMADVSLKAERPLFCALSTGKLAEAGISMPTWEDALHRHLHLRGLLA